MGNGKKVLLSANIPLILATIPAKAGIHIKLIYKHIFNKSSLKNHAEIASAADQSGIQ